MGTAKEGANAHDARKRAVVTPPRAPAPGGGRGTAVSPAKARTPPHGMTLVATRSPCVAPGLMLGGSQKENMYGGGTQSAEDLAPPKQSYVGNPKS